MLPIAKTKIVSFIMMIVLLITAFSSTLISAETDTAENQQNTDNIISLSEYDNGYVDYIAKFDDISRNVQEILLYSGEEKNFAKNQRLDFDVSINEDSLYQISMEYLNTEKRNLDITVYIDGDIPFFEAQSITFPSYWKDSGDKRVDSNGNEFAPEQVLADEYNTVECRDYTGQIAAPYLFYLSKGEHRVSLVLNDGECKFKRIMLKNEENPDPYNSEAIEKDADSYKDVNNVIEIEAEDAFVKSSSALIPKSDDGSADVSPSSPTNAKINYIGGSNWSGQNDEIRWKFNVETAGYYNIAFLYRQTQLNSVSYRHLKIDGKTPFAEAEKIKFKYTVSWNYLKWSENDTPYLIFLSEGEHTLSLSVTAGEYTEIYRQLKELSNDLGDLYIDMTMVIGETVDVSRSYELFNQIPDFNERLKSAADGLEGVAAELERLQEKKGGSNVSTIRNAVEILEKMYNNPYSAHKYKSAYYSSYTNISALLGTITSMPLDIDRIFFIGRDAVNISPKASLIEKIGFGVTRFISSFAGDYAKTEKEENGIQIWVNWGRDQTQVLDSLIQSDFVEKEKVFVTVKLVNASFIQAILSGNGPDVLLQMSRTEPVNLAMRKALVNLEQFDDFDEVITRFQDGATIPFEYNGGTYAIPDSSSFFVMFVRTDILEGLDLQIPKTWQEFIYVMTILQHNNLQVSLPYIQIADSSTVNVGVGGLSLYPTMLVQNGLSLYKDDHTATNLTKEAQIQVFEEWTDMYTKYKVPKTMDFYNRFRIGSAPLGIAVYTLYTQLKAAAPEIEGRWTAVPIPGVVGEDGKINNSSAGSGSGCSITKLSKNPENAWKFLKWWTSASVQLKYSESLESILGPLGRVASSNIEALNNMIWDNDFIEVLNSEINKVTQIPEIPGGYYTARCIDQAFWNVVEQNKIPTDMMLEWGAVADGEISRKRQEYVE